MPTVLPKENEVEQFFSRIMASEGACERLSSVLYDHLSDDDMQTDPDPEHLVQVLLTAYTNGDISALLLELCGRSLFDLLREAYLIPKRFHGKAGKNPELLTTPEGDVIEEKKKLVTKHEFEKFRDVYKNHSCAPRSKLYLADGYDLMRDDDQWSNMLGGTELIRRKLGKDAYAMTINLLLNSEGKKMGKTQSGAVWLDPNKTSPFDFFQYWRNVSDADVLKCIRMLTFLPLEEIDAMESWEGAQLNQAKEILAFELTKLVHGEEEANKAKEASHALFAGGGDSAHMPTLELTAADFADGDLDILALLVKAELAPSRSDARRAVQQGGVSVADEKVTDIQTTYGADAFGADGLVVKRGKKKFVKIVLK